MYEKFMNKVVKPVNEITGEQNVDENALQGTTSPKDTLWSVVLEEALVANKKTVLPVKTTTYDVQEGFNYLPPSAGEAKPNIQVMVITDAGTVAKDGTEDWNSNMSSKIVSVPLTRYSRSFGVSMFDAMKGFQKTAAQVVALVNAIKSEINKDFASLLDTTSNEVEVSAITPATVAHTVSAAFGDYGEVESLALTPANYAQLTPDSALSLKLEQGAYGIGAIYKTAGIPEGTQGYAYNKDAVACAFARPAWVDGMPGVEVYEFEEDGIPYRLKITCDANHNILYHTVDVLFGCAIANERHLSKVVVSD